MSFEDNQNAIFSEEQLKQYFHRVKLPKKYYESGYNHDLPFLTALHRHQVAAIPYENLSLHYSHQKTVDLDPNFLFTKFVTDGRGRGGYCMEGSLFFLNVLRSIGFRAYPTIVRIRLREDGVPKGDYTPLNHTVIIVEISNGGDQVEKYVCDVAFGGDGPLAPMPLKEGVVTPNLGTQEIRFAREGIPKSLGKFWIYQYRNGPEKPWNSFYAFNDTESLEMDFQSISYWTSQGPTFQKTTVMAVKFLLGPADAQGDHHIIGKVMLVNDTFKRNMGGKTELIRVCKWEVERVGVLKAYFGIILTEEEVIGIKGTPTELIPWRDIQVLDE